jgi:hypothetical protein
LKEYLKDNHDKEAKGCFLSSDRRRYLDLVGITTILQDDRDGAATLLDALLGKQLLYRGLILKCMYCRNADWFRLGEIDDGFRCRRCRHDQPILIRQTLEQIEPSWYYQLDEIVYQGLRNDVSVPLLPLDVLRRRAGSFLYTEELTISDIAQTQPCIEIDLCCIADGILTSGEAKVGKKVENGGKAERRALDKYKQICQRLSARRFVLATSNFWSE